MNKDKVSVTHTNDKITIEGICFISLFKRNIKNDVVLPKRARPIINNGIWDVTLVKIFIISSLCELFVKLSILNFFTTKILEILVFKLIILNSYKRSNRSNYTVILFIIKVSYKKHVNGNFI